MTSVAVWQWLITLEGNTVNCHVTTMLTASLARSKKQIQNVCIGETELRFHPLWGLTSGAVLLSWSVEVCNVQCMLLVHHWDCSIGTMDSPVAYVIGIHVRLHHSILENQHEWLQGAMWQETMKQLHHWMGMGMCGRALHWLLCHCQPPTQVHKLL